MANRYSTYSNVSGAGGGRTNTMQASQQVSTTSLLNQVHTAWQASSPLPLESSTSLVVNNWVTAIAGGTVDGELGRKAWEHARRRAEDACIVLGSLHRSAPPLMTDFVQQLPLSVTPAFFTALNVLKPFLHTVTPYNPFTPRFSSLAATFTLNLAGDLTGARINLSTTGIDTRSGLLEVPAENGYRAFDVFYYLLTSTNQKERDYLGLKNPAQYNLLKKSESYSPPMYLPSTDDAAAAEDFRENLKALGIKGKNLRNLLSVIAALLRLGDAVGFLVDGEELEQTCEEVAGLLDIDPEVLVRRVSTEERDALIAGLYEAMVDWIISKANDAIRHEMRTGRQIGSSTGASEDGQHTPSSSHDDGDTVSISVVELPGQVLGKAAALKTVFDDKNGINAEMREDGVPIVAAGSSVVREMTDAVSQCEVELDVQGGMLGNSREMDLDRRQGALEKVGAEADPDSLLKRMLYPVDGDGILTGTIKGGRFSLSNTLGSSRVWFQLCLHPSDDLPANFSAQQNFPWSAGSVSSQIRSWRLAEWANHRNKQLDFTADFDIDEFVDRYSRLGCHPGRDGAESFIMQRGWSNGEVVLGHERIWMREHAWWEAESMLDMKPAEDPSLGLPINAGGMDGGYAVQNPGDGYYGNNYSDNPFASRENLAPRSGSAIAPSVLGARSVAPTNTHTVRSIAGGDYGLGSKGDDKHGAIMYDGEIDPELADGKRVEEQPITFGRRVWVFFAYAATCLIPSFVLKYVGRMKRPDVRMAWREKVLLMLIILFFNALVVFFIVEFGNLLCPNWNKAWNAKEVSYHQGDNDYWVSHFAGVYDLTKFWKLDHSDTNIATSKTNMQPFAGADMSAYIQPPLSLACPGFGISDTVELQSNTTLLYPQALHKSGPHFSTDQTSKLWSIEWYPEVFMPKIKEYYKGMLVIDKNKIKSDGQNLDHMWFILEGKVYDLTDYFHTLDIMDNLPSYAFLPSDVTEMIQSNPGQDLTEMWNTNLNASTRANTKNCMDNMFWRGYTDFRKTARCQVVNYFLLAFTIIICSVILVKFLAALQLGSKRRPAQQDKFVICQVPAYTEGEDQLRKGLDSLTALAYDNKRKLICVICDGMIVGGGNDRPTPKIVLDILGVDPKIDPPALPFRSVGPGADQLNYGKVYSGLYEYEGNVVPYLVVVKVGKQSEQTKSKPGNRGKRDSQILLMSFLNRVHHRSPMSPLELEMFHQINNIIGVDPELYEYLFMVDADTKVKEDSLNRLVASCANDAKIAGICGETSLENEERSWWTMIQVYEYYISHHLAKAFESLFGSVTCLPGCFCMYRLRTADKGRPLIISDKVIKEYADCNVDTLHKKNLLSLGEDRYLTTLMTKHFPQMSYKFIPDAYALTEAPSEWSVLLSQRRRWINSTIHNLAELVFLKDLCGFCCFSMRFVVFIDLFGTIILPATCGYLVYLVYRVASHTGQFPLISVIMIAAVYGLQAIIFIIKRQWQHIGWMIIYLCAYPIYSVVLPIYSFWKQDDFSWGNTRIVIGEKGMKKVVAESDEGFDPRSIPLQRWDDYAMANNLPGRRGATTEKDSYGVGYDQPAPQGGYEMDEMQSVYSSVKPASTILTGFPQQQMYRAPQSPSVNRMSRYTDNPTMGMSMGMGPPVGMVGGQQERLMSMHSASRMQSQDNLLTGMQSPPLYQSGTPSPHPGFQRAQSAISLSGFQTTGPSNEAIVMAVRECLGEVDLDSVTKKQLRSLAEMKLQCQLQGPQKAFLDQSIDDELAKM